MGPVCRPPPARAAHLAHHRGAEDKLGRSVVLRRFVRLAGGRSSRIVVIPTASSFSAEAAALYRTVFARLKAGPDVQIVHPPTRAAASSPELVATIDAATGVFMTGGSQLKLSQNVVGTPVGDAIHRAYRRGAVIAGTSAGASIMSQFMISLGDEGITPASAPASCRPDSGCSRASSSTSTSTNEAAMDGCCRSSPTPPACSGSASMRTPPPRSATNGSCRWSAPGRCSSSTRGRPSPMPPRHGVVLRCWCPGPRCTRCRLARRSTSTRCHSCDSSSATPISRSLSSLRKTARRWSRPMRLCHRPPNH